MKYDETGNKYNRLTAIKKVGSDNGAIWLFRCDCGKEKALRIGHVRSGQIKSCGCANKNRCCHKNIVGERFGHLVVIADKGQIKKSLMFTVRCDCGNEFDVRSDLMKKGKIDMCQKCAAFTKNSKHHMSKTKIYSKWINMIRRCSPTNKATYKYYAGRGISVCDEWKNPEVFIDWAYKNGYNENFDGWEFSLDRIDNDKGYSPDNCRFANRKTQMNNRRVCRMVEYEGMIITVSEAAEITGINKRTIAGRLYAGWSDYDATHKPPTRKRGDAV